MDNPKLATQILAKKYADKGDPDGWFEEFYAQADDEIKKVYWADLEPNPMLLDWVDRHPRQSGRREIGDHSQTFPIALDRNEIDGFVRSGLIERHFLAYDDNQEPPVPHFLAVYSRPATKGI